MSKGIVGLSNIGNTCYGNATIQALRHQVDFTLFLLQNHHSETLKSKPLSEKTKLLESYDALIKKMWNGEDGWENTREFWGYMVPAAIKSGVEHFRMPVAHDAHEFLVFLLDQFHEALAEEVDMIVKADPANKEVYAALSAWKRAFEKSYSPLVSLVFGLQRKSICCETCKRESLAWETMNMIKVSVPTEATKEHPFTLQDLICAENEGEVLDDYACDSEHCKAIEGRQRARLGQSVWRLGNWVIIVLKRIQNNMRRINTPVEIPFTTSFESVFHPESREPSKSAEYSLFATIHHHGSANGGHYTAHAKHPVTGKWIHYDDERATVLEDELPMLDYSTYIVMYRCAV